MDKKINVMDTDSYTFKTRRGNTKRRKSRDRELLRKMGEVHEKLQFGV